MDDSLELPILLPSTIPRVDPEANDESSGDEDGALDWSSLRVSQNVSIDRPIIPKRGEKDYEPTGGPSKYQNTGSNLQKHSLDRARDAMYTALTANRGISSKTVSYGLWYPGTSHVEVALARGTMFAGMGYFNQRSVLVGEGATKEVPSRKRLELLPEEALFLIERGSMYCWRAEDGDNSIHQQVASAGQLGVALEEVIGTPMSVQQAFAEMICEGRTISLEEYQVFAYLKRLGYVVTRARQPDGAATYPTAGRLVSPISSKPPISSVIFRLAFIPFRWLQRVWSPFSKSIECLQPLYTSSSMLWWPRQGAESIFKQLRFIPAGHSTPLLMKKTTGQSPYTPKYHVYKPSTPFRKSAPPSPDFYVVVVKAQSTPLPTLREMNDVFESLPLSAPLAGPKKQPTVPRDTRPMSPSWMTWFKGALPFGLGTTVRPPNPFPALKAGHKSFIVAAVSGGSISFIKFSEGSFEDWPMI
ncbi:tRNA-splicing endonuclease subunit sen54 [Tulasnella sp. JGI-2019a]|nr:tRNA-splicing endonuclease subunit sen54 [Tulasnella sp. JGI-2019a]